MWMILKLGIRNVFRNKIRTLVTCSIMGLLLSSAMVMDGFWKGMLTNMVETLTESYMGHGQIHSKKYIESLESKFILEDPDLAVNWLEQTLNAKKWTGRVHLPAMATSSDGSENVAVIGIDAEREKGLSEFDDRIVEGEYPSQPTDVLIGTDLKDRLNLNINDRMVITTHNVVTEETSQGLFRVKGVYHFGSKEMDLRTVLITISSAQELLGKSHGVHELAFQLDHLPIQKIKKLMPTTRRSPMGSANLGTACSTNLGHHPTFDDFNVNFRGNTFGTGRVDSFEYTFMSIYDRLFEFSVYQALGHKRKEIILMVIAEGIGLASLSVIIATIFTLVLGGMMAVWGVDYGGIEFGEMTFTRKIYYEFHWQQFVIYPLSFIIFTALVSFYPGWHASRLTLADTLKKSL
ncbi:MAG: FtsX-like permease family protein [Bdellovibrionales bacterium]